jgi:hypothetical protein
MKILRNLAIYAATGALILALGSVAWSQQTGNGNSPNNAHGNSTNNSDNGNNGGNNNGSYNSGNGVAHGAMSTQGNGSLDGSGMDASTAGRRSTIPPGDGSSAPPQTEEEMAKLRNIERQKKLEDDTAKLLSLANELKADVDKSTKDMLSLDVVKKADEIEKLAHSVKERMKGT